VAAAQQARSKGDLEAAQQHVTAGLVVKPADATLLALRDDLRAELKARDAERDRSRQAQARTVKKAPVPETPPEEKKGFFSRLFGR
ncbi:MAG: hypothetical protein K0S16_1415, partial [Moraxellaceae bacterium]|nr:hypothetical protein [Moraxellaceae bacterium]